MKKQTVFIDPAQLLESEDRKMKVRDEVLVMGTIADEKEGYNGAWDYFVVFEDAGSQWLPAGAIRPLRQPAPVWRDGATNPPKIGEQVYIMYKNEEHDAPVEIKKFTCASDNNWEHHLWLPADEFPMPSMPEPNEPEIVPCPFCGGECVTEKNYTLWALECCRCSYQSRGYPTEADAIAAHNELARKARG